MARLGSFLEAHVAMGHLHSTYDGVLYGGPSRSRTPPKRRLIYLKNYRQRLR